MSAHEPTEALRAAADWYSRLTAGGVTDADRHAWQRWKESRAENAVAWQRVEQVTGVFQRVPSAIGMAALNHTQHSASRRRALKQFSVLIAAGSAGWAAYRHEPWDEMLADYATATGEQREVVLADGTHVHLNTASAISVAYGADQRVIHLIKGEILVVTGHESSARYRPFIVKTRHGSGTALGTRFIVRQFEYRSRIGVFEHAVEVAPANTPGAKQVVQAGAYIEFGDGAVLLRGNVDAAEMAWSKGFMVVDQMPLRAFVNELARYRSGLLRCDPAIAELRISGAFPVRDTDATLSSIANILPIRIETYTRYWVSIRPG